MVIRRSSSARESRRGQGTFEFKRARKEGDKREGKDGVMEGKKAQEG